MSEVHPIRADIQPMLDKNRELLEWVIIQLEQHEAAYTEPADTIALVTTSPKGRRGNSYTTRPDTEQDKLGTCAAAAAILLERAVQP